MYVELRAVVGRICATTHGTANQRTVKVYVWGTEIIDHRMLRIDRAHVRPGYTLAPGTRHTTSVNALRILVIQYAISRSRGAWAPAPGSATGAYTSPTTGGGRSTTRASTTPSIFTLRFGAYVGNAPGADLLRWG